MKEGVSIIICFYNSGVKIVPTLEHIKKLHFDLFNGIELILVDNNSSDHTNEIIQQTLSENEFFPWKIVHESNPGLTNARLRGIQESNYDILLFCDDDNWLKEDYLQMGIDILDSESRIAVLGGNGVPVSSIKIPDWFEKNQNFYACGPQFNTSGRVLGARNVVYGAGMFVRKKYWEAIIAAGFVPISSDRKGGSLSSGGDSEMCLAFQIAGYHIWYDERLLFQHYIEPDRLTQKYFEQLKKGMSTSRFYTRYYLEFLIGKKIVVTNFFWIKELIYVFRDLFLNTLRNNFSDYTRQRAFIRLLLSQRKLYDQTVKKTLETCQKLNELRRNHD